jgi:CRP/FNR family transcriptional regulator
MRPSTYVLPVAPFAPSETGGSTCASIGRLPGAQPPSPHLPALGLVGDLAHARKRVPRGGILYRAGAYLTSVYSIRCGFFKTSVGLEDGRMQVTGFHMAGDFLGMDGLGTRSHASEAMALEDSEVCIFPYERLDEPDLRSRLGKAMSRELVHNHGVMLLLGTMCAAERLAAFLLNLSRRLEARGFSPRHFHLRMTREEIGSYLGLSLETVSRVFSHFQQEGALSVDRREVRIEDIVRLQAMISLEARPDPRADKSG